MNDFDAVGILLVEDNRHDAEMTLRALGKCNFPERVFWVKDGVEALEFIRCTGAYAGRDARESPKLILLDLKMPRLDGLAVLRDLKADERTRSIPILAMTSSSQERDIEDSYRLGVNAFVTKPLDSKEFQDTIAGIGTFWLTINTGPEM
jgi:CheY-like chemotaxis protein